MVGLAVGDLLLPHEKRMRKRPTRLLADGLDLGLEPLELDEAEEEEVVLCDVTYLRRALLVEWWGKRGGTSARVGRGG